MKEEGGRDRNHGGGCGNGGGRDANHGNSNDSRNVSAADAAASTTDIVEYDASNSTIASHSFLIKLNTLKDRKNGWQVVKLICC